MNKQYVLAITIYTRVNMQCAKRIHLHSELHHCKISWCNWNRSPPSFIAIQQPTTCSPTGNIGSICDLFIFILSLIIIPHTLLMASRLFQMMPQRSMDCLPFKPGHENLHLKELVADPKAYIPSKSNLSIPIKHLIAFNNFSQLASWMDNWVGGARLRGPSEFRVACFPW